MHVLLVHGLGRSPVSVWGLGRYLRRHGYTTELFGYLAAAESLDAIRERLHQRILGMARRGPYSLVGHSLGGLLLRECALQVTPRPEHLVMLGTPNRLPRLARRLKRYWPLKVATGEAGQLLADEAWYASLPVPPFPYTIIAGTAGARGRLSPFKQEPSDGTVAVAETRITDDDRLVLLPVRHTFMIQDTRVRAAVVAALRAAPDDRHD